MKICLVTPTFPIGDKVKRGGTNTYAETAAKALAAHGAEVRIVAYDMPPETESPAGLPVTVHLVRLPSIPYLSTLLPGVIESWALRCFLVRLDRRERFTALEGGNYEGWLLFTALRFNDRFWMRCYTSLGHCIQQRGQELTWRRRFAVWLDGFAVRRTRHLVTHSRCHALEMGAEYRIDPARVQVVPLAIDYQLPPVFPPADRLPRSIGYVGILDKRKGIDVLLEAIPAVLERVPDARFEIVGYDGGDSPAESWAAWFAAQFPAPARSGRVTFHGALSDARLREVWQQIEIITVPSRYKSFGLVVVEGFARGNAVVTTTGGALAEVAKNGAWLVEPGRAAPLADALIQLLTTPGAATELAQRGRALYNHHYSLETFVANVLNLLSPEQERTKLK